MAKEDSYRVNVRTPEQRRILADMFTLAAKYGRAGANQVIFEILAAYQSDWEAKEIERLKQMNYLIDSAQSAAESQYLMSEGKAESSKENAATKKAISKAKATAREVIKQRK